MQNKTEKQLHNINNRSADQGLMIRSLVPEEPMGETDCSTVILSPKIINNTALTHSL